MNPNSRFPVAFFIPLLPSIAQPPHSVIAAIADILPPSRTRATTFKDTIPCINPGTMETLGYAPAMTPNEVCYTPKLSISATEITRHN